MVLVPLSTLALFVSSVFGAAATYTATYTPGHLPYHSEGGQAGYNNCTSGSSPTSKCQNLYVNGIDDFCLWGPPSGGTIGNTERVEVAYCLRSGYGTRLFPEGTIKITGFGDFTKIGITKNDAGGELDPHGADGKGNPIGGLVFAKSFSADGKDRQMFEWSNFMSATEFCIRACNPDGPNPKKFCPHIYDVMGCQWNMPANYATGYFEQCLGDSGQYAGIYTTKGTTSTFHQGNGHTPAAHPAPHSSKCTRVQTLPYSLTTVPVGATPNISLSTTKGPAASPTLTYMKKSLNGTPVKRGDGPQRTAWDEEA